MVHDPEISWQDEASTYGGLSGVAIEEDSSILLAGELDNVATNAKLSSEGELLWIREVKCLCAALPRSSAPNCTESSP